MSTKLAIITGGNRGIGRSIMDRFVEEGYHVATIHKDIRQAINKRPYTYLEMIGDIRIQADVEKFFLFLGDPLRFNEFVLVNNAGIASAKKFMDLTALEFTEMFDTNVIGAFRMSKAFVQWTGNRPLSVYRHIINISSVSGLTGFSGHAHYCASKFALDGMSKTMTKELSKLNILVNNVCPGPTNTDMWEELDKQYRENGFMPSEAHEDDYFQKLLIKRMGSGKDVADAVLALSKMNYVTGINFPVCGGNILR